jgi:uncharacterized membrane protein
MSCYRQLRALQILQRVDSGAARSDQYVRLLHVVIRFFATTEPMFKRLFSRPRFKRLAFAAFCGGACLSSSAAWADLRLCNNATTRVSVALSYTDGKGWVTEGWWNLKSGACETLLRGPLAAQFYYVYGMDERGGEWKGKAFMCTRDREFRIEGRENCLVRGYDRTGFFEVDTGKDAKNWTVQLSDSNEPQGPR